MKLKKDIEWLKQKYIDEGLSCQRIAELLGNTICRQAVYNRLKKIGIKTRAKKDAIFYIDGERCKISQDYFWIYKPEHPRSNGGYVKRSVLNLEKKLGRYLINGEMPHHIDCNRMNDELTNLEVTDRVNHPKIHKSDKIKKRANNN